MKTPDGEIWCDECQYQVFKNPITIGDLHFCDDLCRDIYLSEHEV